MNDHDIFHYSRVLKLSTRFIRVLLLVVFFLMGVPARAQEPVTCAIIADQQLGLGDSVLVGLLETDLSKNQKLALVERAMIKKAVDERILQLSLTAEGLDSRRRLGSFLKAQVLILLSAGEEKAGVNTIRYVNTVIAETSSGVRLTARRHAWDDSQPKDALAAIESDVKNALAKRHENIRAIVAVPPFLCEDFTFHYTALQAIYANDVEQYLMHYPGIQVVELAEARALAKELEISGGEAVTRPRQPFYVTGQYKNDGLGSRRKVEISLRLEQGTKVLDQISSRTLNLDEIAGFITSQSGTLLDKALGLPTAPGDSPGEVRQILARAEEFERLRMFREAAGLYEAAILLQPSPPLHEQAFHNYLNLITSLHDIDHGLDGVLDHLRQASELQIVATDHLEKMIRGGCKVSFDTLENFTTYYNTLTRGISDKRELSIRMNRTGLVRQMDQVRDYQKQMMRSVMREASPEYPLNEELFGFIWRFAYSAQGGSDSLLIHLRSLMNQPDAACDVFTWAYRYYCDRKEELSETDPLRLEFSRRLRQEPGDAFNYVYRLLDVHFSTTDLPTKDRQFNALAEEIRKNDAFSKKNPIFVSLLDRMHLELNKGDFIKGKDRAENYFSILKTGPGVLYRSGRYIPPPPNPGITPTPNPAGQAITAKPITFKGIDDIVACANRMVASGNDKYGVYGDIARRSIMFRGLIACPSGTDIYWSRNTIYAMPAKGVLNILYRREDTSGQLRSVVFDGKYVWGSYDSFVSVVELATGQVDQFTGKDGLPPGQIVLAPLEPGHVCLAGYFGRSWIANAYIGGKEGKKIEVFHKADRSGDPAKDPNAAFVPYYAYAMAQNHESSHTLVFLADGEEGAAGGFPYSAFNYVNNGLFFRGTPRIVDPWNKTVRLAEQEIWARTNFVCRAGCLYTVDQMSTSKASIRAIMRYPAPDPRRQTGADSFSYHKFFDITLDGYDNTEQLVLYRNLILRLNDHLWVIDPDLKRERCLGLIPEEYRSTLPVVSNHYGLMLLNWGREGMSFIQCVLPPDFDVFPAPGAAAPPPAPGPQGTPLTLTVTPPFHGQPAPPSSVAQGKALSGGPGKPTPSAAAPQSALPSPPPLLAPQPRIPSSGAPVTCALVADAALDLPDSAAFALLTAELSRQPALALLERAEVGRVLQERSLQLALAAEGLEARRALGTLLKARLLVLLRAGEKTVNAKKIRFVNLAISETASGLRLVQDELVWDEASPAALGKPVAADVAMALARLAQPASAIVAVPPFLSDDLEHRYDAMQEAYARLLTGTLAGVPGLRLVELAEAQAVADEIRLTGGGKINRELLPYYLQGRYRNQARDGRSSPTVTLELELRRGEQSLGQRRSTPLAAEAAGEFLCQSAKALLEPVLKSKAAPFNPALETAELLRQARQFEQLGEYEKALTLVEAALLLQPAVRETLKYAIDLTTQQLNALDAAIHNDPAPPAERYDAAIERAIALDLRALDHMALYLRLCNENIYSALYRDFLDGGWTGDHDHRKFFQAGRRAFVLKIWDPRLRPRISELSQAKRETIVDYFEYLADHPQVKSGNLSLNPLGALEICPGQFLAIQEPAATTRLALMRLIRAIAKHDAGHEYETIAELIKVGFPDPKDEEAYLSEVASLSGGQYATIAQYGRMMHEPLTPVERLIRLKRMLDETSTTEVAAQPSRGLWHWLDQEAFGGYVVLRNERIKARRAAALALGEQAAAGPPAPGDDPALDPFRSYYLKETKGKPPVTAAQSGNHATTATAGNDYTLAPIRNAELAGQNLLGWIEARNGYDLIWSDQCIYALTPAGQLKLLFFLTPPRGRPALQPLAGRGGDAGAPSLQDVVFDGRWAWAVLKDRLVVIDPERGTLQQVDAQNGLPPGEMAVAPLGPGRVCVVGGFGRGWCANVTYEEPGAARVDVFHEARLVRGEWNDPHVVFKPRFAAAYTGVDGQPRVLVGREMDGRGQYFPLLLDPGRRTVEVVMERLSNRLRSADITHDGGTLCWIAQTDEIVDKMIPFYNPSATIPCARLERWSGAADHPQVLFNNVPVPTTRTATLVATWLSRDLASTTFMAEVRQGRTYVFARDCWELDRAGGRLVQLRGPGLKTLGRWRLGHSSRFGTVLISPAPQGICAYAFQPGAPMTARPEGRQIVPRDPLEGTELVLRRYPVGATTDYTTLTTQLRAGSVVLEWEESTTSTLLVLLGQDQPVPWVREALANRITLYGGLFQVHQRWLRDERCMDYFFFPREPVYRAAPQSWLFTDARGKALANARVRVVYHFLDHSLLSPAPGGKIRYDFSLELPGGTTDATGRLDLVVATPPYGYIECQVSQPNYGTASCPMVWMGNTTGAGVRLLDGGGGGVVRMPLARRGSAESLRALRGRLVDEQGRGVGGRLVTAFLKESEAGRGWPTLEHLEHAPGGVLSQGDGSFTLYPVSEAADSPELPGNTPLRVRVSHPEHPETPLREAWLDNARDQLITLPAPAPPTSTLAARAQPAPRRSAAQAGAPANSARRGSATTPLQMPPVVDPPTVQVALAGSVALTPATPQIPAGPPTPPPTATPRPGAAGLDPEALIERRREGHVIDGRSGAPLAGVYIVAGDNFPEQTRFMASQWRMLHDNHGPWTGESEALLLLRVAQGNLDAIITRTDASGHFTLKLTRWDRFNAITALEQNYRPSTLDGRSGGSVSNETLTILPLLKLYPEEATTRPAQATQEVPSNRELARRCDAWLKYTTERKYDFSPQVDEARTSAARGLALLNAPGAPRAAWAVKRATAETSAAAAQAAPANPPPGDPDFQQAGKLYEQHHWAESRAAWNRYAAAHPASPGLPEAQIKSLLCLYALRQFEAFHLEAQDYLEQHPSSGGPLQRSLAWHLALADLELKQRCLALQDCKNYLDTFPDGEAALPAMHERARLALALAREFLSPDPPPQGFFNIIGMDLTPPIPYRRLQGDAARLAGQGRELLRQYRARLIAARAGAGAQQLKELNDKIAEADELEKKNADLFQINWQIALRLKKLFFGRGLVYLLLALLAAIILLRKWRRGAGQPI